MALLAAAGKLLKGSGWTESLVLAGVTTAGKADSLLAGSKGKATRYAHQVTLACLYHLRLSAYQKYQTSEENHVEFEVWCNLREIESPQFAYWNLVIELELTILVFVRSLRESNEILILTKHISNEICQWFFALLSLVMVELWG